jgi:hypothetical protein
MMLLCLAGKLCDMVVLTIDLNQRQQELAGQSVYFLVHANITRPQTGVSLSINGVQSADYYSPPGLRSFNVQATLGSGGKAVFGIRVFTSDAAVGPALSVVVGTMVVSKVGNDWSRLLLG